MLKNISNLGTALSSSEQEEITGGMFPFPTPTVCNGTGGKRTPLSQSECYLFGYSWEYGACYICY